MANKRDVTKADKKNKVKKNKQVPKKITRPVSLELAMIPSEVNVTKKRGRPPKAKTKETVDLNYLKQTTLLDNVEELIEKKLEASKHKDIGIKEIVVPYTPSVNQREVHALLEKHRFGVVVVHRGFGKTWLAANELIRRAWSCQSKHGGKFIYVAPEKLQAKKIVWRELKFFVKELPHTINEAELTITFPNGSTIELAGADNPDRLRGIHPHFVVLDEVAQMPKDTWYEAVYPSLRANRGGALFIGTPKGENLFKELYDHGKNSPGWFSYLRTIEQTTVATPEQIVELRHTMPPQKYEQEYMCSFDAAIVGAYYDHAFANGDIISYLPYDPAEPVFTGWDLGINDPTCVWFCQRDRRDKSIIRVIDYYEKADPDFMVHLKVVLTKPYLFGHHYMPHDVGKRLGLGSINRYEICRKHGMDVRVASKEIKPLEGITMVQNLLPMCRFDADKCKDGIRRLRQYSAKQDRMTGEFMSDAKHDQNSHAADAFRYLAVGLKRSHDSTAAHLSYAVADYDYFSPSTAGRTNHEADESNYDIFNPGRNGSRW